MRPKTWERGGFMGFKRVRWSVCAPLQSPTGKNPFSQKIRMHLDGQRATPRWLRAPWPMLVAPTRAPAPGPEPQGPRPAWTDSHCEEPVYDLAGDRVGAQSGRADASDAPHGLMPLQAAGASTRPISLQPFGQWSLRVVCGVAALVDSRAIHCAPRLAFHPAQTAARPLGDRKQALGPSVMARA